MRACPTVSDHAAYCRAQLRSFLARAERGTLVLRQPPADGLWLRQPKMHFHTFPELFLQPSGCTRFVFPSGGLLLRAGQTCLLPAGLPHRAFPAPPNARSRHMVLGVHSPREVSMHLTLNPSARRSLLVVFDRSIRGAAASRMAGYLDDILATDGAHRQSGVNGLLVALLATLLDHLDEAEPAAREHLRITQCRQLLATQLGNSTLGVTSLAHQLGCAPAYLSWLFHRECGVTLTAHLNRARIEQALFLLRHTTRSIKEISAACGFSRPNYFIQVFHRLQGTPPSRYRRALDAQAADAIRPQVPVGDKRRR